jgi:hypothetical protein
MMPRLMLFSILIFLFTACQELSNMTQSENPMNEFTTEFDAEAIQAFIGAEFPESASNIHFVGEAALDTMVAVRLDLPAADLMPYLQSLGVSESLVANRSPFYTSRPPYPEAANWWQIVTYGENTVSHSGLSERVGNRVYSVLVLNPGADEVTIYLRVHTT